MQWFIHDSLIKKLLNCKVIWKKKKVLDDKSQFSIEGVNRVNENRTMCVSSHFYEKKKRVNEFLQRGCPQGSPRYFRDWRRSRWRQGEKNEWNPLEGRFCASDLCRSGLTFTTLHIHTRACHTNPPSVFEARQSRNPSLLCSSRCVTCIVNALFSLCPLLTRDIRVN